MNAPTKQRSINATNKADRRVELSRTSVAIAHAQARIETMKRTRMLVGVSWLLVLYPWTNHDWEWSVHHQFVDCQQLTSMPMIGINVTIWATRHEPNKNPPNIVTDGLTIMCWLIAAMSLQCQLVKQMTTTNDSTTWIAGWKSVGSCRCDGWVLLIRIGCLVAGQNLPELVLRTWRRQNLSHRQATNLI